MLQEPIKERSLSCRVSNEGAQADELPVLGHQDSHRTLGLRAGSPVKVQCLEVGAGMLNQGVGRLYTACGCGLPNCTTNLPQGHRGALLFPCPWHLVASLVHTE